MHRIWCHRVGRRQQYPKVPELPPSGISNGPRRPLCRHSNSGIVHVLIKCRPRYAIRRTLENPVAKMVTRPIVTHDIARAPQAILQADRPPAFHPSMQRSPWSCKVKARKVSPYERPRVAKPPRWAAGRDGDQAGCHWVCPWSGPIPCSGKLKHAVAVPVVHVDEIHAARGRPLPEPQHPLRVRGGHPQLAIKDALDEYRRIVEIHHALAIPLVLDRLAHKISQSLVPAQHRRGDGWGSPEGRERGERGERGEQR